MHRFFCPSENITPINIQIKDKDELHHLRDVLRLKIGDVAEVLDGKGSKFLAEIIQITKKEAVLRIDNCQKREQSRPSLSIACALPKRSKVDFIIEKLTEIGVNEIILLKTERVEVFYNDFSAKLEKLSKLAISAIKQSGNAFLPKIQYLDFKDLLKLVKDFDLALLPVLVGDRKKIKDVLSGSIPRKILAAIGPEGDFSGEEISLAQKAGFVLTDLGNSVLRVETAAVVTAGFIKLFSVSGLSGQSPDQVGRG